MKAAIFKEKGKMEVVEKAMPELSFEDSAIIRTVRASVCGSDLWFFRGIDQEESGKVTGHEAIGIVEKVGPAVKNIKPGDFVIAPFVHGCGHCAACLAGFEGECQNNPAPFNNHFQAEYFEYNNANWGLVKIPGKPEDYTDEELASFQTLADVMPTGFHAAKMARVKKGDTVVVLGDGAVGLCAILSAKFLGAKKIISTSRHADREALAHEFGATDNVAVRGDEGVKQIRELTNGAGADAVLECVGSELSRDTAVKVARAGAMIGRVGVPHDEKLDSNQLFFGNLGIQGGPASVTTWDRKYLLDAVLKHEINPGRVFTAQFKLDDIQKAYEVMDQRKAIKSLLVF